MLYRPNSTCTHGTLLCSYAPLILPWHFDITVMHEIMPACHDLKALPGIVDFYSVHFDVLLTRSFAACDGLQILKREVQQRVFWLGVVMERVAWLERTAGLHRLVDRHVSQTYTTSMDNRTTVSPGPTQHYCSLDMYTLQSMDTCVSKTPTKSIDNETLQSMDTCVSKTCIKSIDNETLQSLDTCTTQT